MKSFDRRVSECLFALAALTTPSLVDQSAAQAQQVSVDTKVDELRKEREQDFGLHEKTAEQTQAQVNKVTLEVARIGQTSNRLLRVVATTGAVWDQTVGAPVRAPEPGTVMTIKRTMLGGMMCKIGKWTAYRCIRVDRPTLSSLNPEETPRAMEDASPSTTAHAEPLPGKVTSSLPASAHSGESVQKVEQPSAVPTLPTEAAAASKTVNASQAQYAVLPTTKVRSSGDENHDEWSGEAPEAVSGTLSQSQQANAVVPPPRKPAASPVTASASKTSRPISANHPSGEELQKENQRNFGLHEKTVENRRIEVDEVTVKVARVAETSNRLLRIIATSGAVWDQTVGAPVRPPQPGTTITIKRAMFGSAMCKIGKWTTYRCIRVDRANLR